MGRLTQGTVFCGGFAEDYRGLPVWGVVITARCDTTHEKVPLVNYLPLVRITDWLHSDGGFVLADRALESVRNDYRNLLRANNLAPSLIDVHSPQTVAQINFPAPDQSDNSKKAQKQRADRSAALSFADHIERLQRISEAARIEPGELRYTINRHSSAAQKLLKELMSYQLAGYYYLPDLGRSTEHHSPDGYVVLLREIHHLPRSATRKLTDGLVRSTDSVGTRALTLDCFEIACPIAEIVSPWIEHLMQAFTNLFARIGIADTDLSRATTLLEQLRAEQP